MDTWNNPDGDELRVTTSTSAYMGMRDQRVFSSNKAYADVTVNMDVFFSNLDAPAELKAQLHESIEFPKLYARVLREEIDSHLRWGNTLQEIFDTAAEQAIPALAQYWHTAATQLDPEWEALLAETHVIHNAAVQAAREEEEGWRPAPLTWRERAAAWICMQVWRWALPGVVVSEVTKRVKDLDHE